MFESGLPIGIGVHQMEFIGAFEMFVRVFLSQTTAIDCRCCDQSHSGETFIMKLMWK